MHGEPAFFEIGVPDAKLAKAFYGQLFNWTFHSMGGDQAWVETPTIRGGHAEYPRPAEPGFGRFAFCRDDQGRRPG